MDLAELDAATQMRVRLAITRVRQTDVALRMGEPRDRVSLILNGYAPIPAGWQDRFNAAVDALERREAVTA